jgi:hypothetical protein
VIHTEPEPTPAPAAAEPSTDGDGDGRPLTWGEEFAWVLDHCYALLAGALVLLMLSYLAKLRWPGGVDIWEHAAAARELGAHPFHPQHPLLPVDALHQFNSPYLMAVGLFARFAALSVPIALDVAAVFNLILILVSLRLFIRRLTPRPHVDFYALLFILFLWGPGAWFFSGFLHFDVLAVVLSYPSTFAKGVVFLALWAHLNYLERDDPKWLLSLLFASAIVLLTHPVDAVFLGIGVLALSFTHPTGRRERRVVVTLAVLIASALLAFLWPPLPLLDLLFGKGPASYRTAIGAADKDMYSHILVRVGLALVVIPFALRRLDRWRTDPLVLMYFGTLAAYGFGYYTENYSYGRLISSAQIVGAIILADERAWASEAAAALGSAGRPLLRWVQVTTLAIVVLGVFYMRNGFNVLPAQIMADVPYSWSHSYVDNVKLTDFDFLAQHHKEYPVTISDIYTSLELPTFGTKVIAFARAQAFVDTAQRGTDLGTFYNPASSAEVRRQIIDKYGASLLVVNVTDLTNDPNKFKPLVDLGTVVSRNQRFVFVDLRRH